MTDPKAGHQQQPTGAARTNTPNLLTWAAELVRIVCAHPDDEMAERVRAVAFQMKNAYDKQKIMVCSRCGIEIIDGRRRAQRTLGMTLCGNCIKSFDSVTRP